MEPVRPRVFARACERASARGIALAVVVAVVVGTSSLALAAGVGPAATAGPALRIDAGADRHAISPDIYGMSFADRSRAATTGVTLDRFGGNGTSRFDPVTDGSNTGSDWYFENIPPTASGSSDDDWVTADRAVGLRTLMTVPTNGWVAKAPVVYGHPYPCGFPRSAEPQQDSFDPWDSECGNGRWQGNDLSPGARSRTSRPFDTSDITAWVRRLVGAYGDAAHGGVPLYELDNEPSLWSSTHRDIHPTPLGFFAYSQTAIAGAIAIKSGDPTAQVIGPGDWGWCAYFYSPSDPSGCSDGPDRAAHGGLALGDYYLQRFKAASDVAGHRLLDVFDEHYYPQAPGVALSPAGSAATKALRLRSTRSLWDPTYIDESWISSMAPGGVAVRLIPRLRSWIATWYPGTKLSISEYDFGGPESMNGALAQADALGIFARERVDLAAHWGVPDAGSPTEFAFRVYRNYDGAGGKFGDVWVRSTSADQGKLAVYGAQRGAKGSLSAVVINKTGVDLRSALSLSGFAARGNVQVWRYAGTDLGHITRAVDGMLVAGRVTQTYPANSITMLVFPPLDLVAPLVTSPPQPGLLEFVEMSGTQTQLTWAATDLRRVERFTLQRSVGGGPWTAVALSDATLPRAWVSVAPGVTNRYRVRAVDGAGNASAWAVGPALTTTLIDDGDPSIVYAGNWNAVSRGSASGGSLHGAGTGGTPSATLTFTGRAVAYIAERRTSDDLVTVLVDGVPLATRSLQSFRGGGSLSDTVPRQIVFARSWPTRGQHTITIRGASVNLDAFVVLDTP